jgi:cytoskeletal protein RodZ
MSQHRIAVLVGLLVIVTTTLAVAQTSPTSDKTAPSAASSPAQRSATASPATESPTTDGTDPSAASTPHQKQVTAAATTSHQQMKDCMTKEKAKDSSTSKEQMQKTCTEQMKTGKTD